MIVCGFKTSWRIVPCQRCGRGIWLDLTKPHPRPTRWCSNACKQAAYRDRRDGQGPCEILDPHEHNGVSSTGPCWRNPMYVPNAILDEEAAR